MSLLQIQHISKSYAGAPLLRDLSFDVAAGEIVCLLGPSGTGKTTLLRLIAGLEEADAGRVRFEGRDLASVPPHERGIGLMFQDLALFPHRNVFDNVAFGLRMLNPPTEPAARAARVNGMLELVGLDPKAFAPRDVNRLSGGEQQRVALARSLAPRPRLVMFDEPLGALDRILREELVVEVRALLKRLAMTALYVTHDQEEAFAIADRLILLNAGRIEQSGTPVELYQYPANAFVARFLGLTNLIPVERLERQGAAARLITRAGIFELNAVPPPDAAGGFVLLRPRAVERIRASNETRANAMRGRIVETQWRAGRQQIVVESGAGALVFEWDGALPKTEPVTLELDANELQWLSAR